MLSHLTKDEAIGGCKALGLVGWLVTKPLWSVIEDVQTSIIDMNTKYSQFLQFCHDVVQYLDDFMVEECLPFGNDTYVHKDLIFHTLDCCS